MSQPVNASMSNTHTEDLAIMNKVRMILNRGNNAEIKRSKDGLTVLEVKKKKM